MDPYGDYEQLTQQIKSKPDLSSLFWLIDWLLLDVKCYSILPTLKVGPEGQWGRSIPQVDRTLNSISGRILFLNKKSQRSISALIYEQWLITWQEGKDNYKNNMVAEFLIKKFGKNYMFRNCRMRTKWEHICFLCECSQKSIYCGRDAQKDILPILLKIRRTSLLILVSFFH